MKDIIASFWSKNAPYIEFSKEARLAIRLENEPYIEPLLKELSGKVLEVGCGVGYDTQYLRQRGVNVTAIDLSESNAQEAGGIQADVENLPFADNYFDMVYSFGVLHHTPDTKKAVAEIYRVLRPGGKVIIMIYHKGFAYRWLRLLGKGMNDYDHTPLSKQYSVYEAWELFYKFKNVTIDITTYAPNRLAWWVLNKSKFLMYRFGSFIIIRGEKQ